MAVFSMTGYAQVHSAGAAGTISVTLKSVNHRFLDLRWQVPSEWEGETAGLEKRLRARLRRGHVDIRLGYESASSPRPPAELNLDVVDAYLSAHATLAQRLHSSESPSPAELLRLPGAFVPRAATSATEALRALLAPAFDAALEQLDAMRRAEGVALVRDLELRLGSIRTAAAAIARHRPELEAVLLQRLRARMQDLLGTAGPPPERLLQEAALLAERGDISEELTRLEAHVEHGLALLAAGGEVGKKLDFLSQELNREVNTLLSKTSPAVAPALAISELGLGLKSEIEKIREQVQNLE